jgi:hypothetical protein
VENHHADAEDDGNESEDDDVANKSIASKLWSYLPGSGKKK